MAHGDRASPPFSGFFAATVPEFAGSPGAIPLDPNAATVIPLPDEFIDCEDRCCAGNGFVSTQGGKTLIIGHSNLARLLCPDMASSRLLSPIIC